MDQKILLIDDSAILRRIATNVLSTRPGCGEVVTATRATEGFARACAAGIGLILVDHQLAGQPPADLCQRLHDEPRTTAVPVILLLGRGMTPPPAGTLPANVIDFLVKPFTPEQLVSKVEAVLGLAKSPPPIRRLRESSSAPQPSIKPALTDKPEVAAAVSVAALVRRETNRIHSARTLVHSKARVTAVFGHQTSPPRTAEPARLRTALLDAVARRPTGIFRVTSGNGLATELYFDNGQIVMVATHDAAGYSQDAEGVVPPKVSTAIFDDAVAEQARTGVPFFLTLGSRGLLSKAAAVGLLHRFGQQHFARLWTVPPATLAFAFEELDALPGVALRLEALRESVDEWLLGTLRYLQPRDLSSFARQEGLGGSVAFRKNGPETLLALGLCEQEQGFAQQVDGRRDLATIARALGVTSEHAFLLLFRFRSLGIMEYRPAASVFVITPRTNVRRVLPLQR